MTVLVDPYPIIGYASAVYEEMEINVWVLSNFKVRSYIRIDVRFSCKIV